jgi:hypothetical protein
VTEVSEKALKITITSEVITVFKETKAVTNITYLYVKRSVIFINSQVAD